MKYRLLLIAFLLPSATLAQNGQGFGAVRWDYVSGNLAIPSLDEIGWEIDGSLAVTDRLVVFGGFRDWQIDDGIDRSMFQVGVGHRWDVRPSMDVMVSLSYGDNEFDTRLGSSNDEGLILGGHVRGWITQRFELNGSLLLDNSAGSSTDTVVEFGLQFFHRPNWSIGGRIRKDDYDTTTFAGVRAYFGASRR